MKDTTKRLIAYGVVLVVGIGLLVYGVEVEMESVRELASGLIGVAIGGAGLKRVGE